jgi:acetylornithine/succinyldiaminopimelate/putrescine aminotransferase
MASATITDQDVSRLLAMAAGYGRWFVGVPHEQMMNVLHQAREHLRSELALKFGPDVANTICEAFIPAVISARRELEGGDASRVVN